ncbi:MAG: zinc ribbon domain-containing protein [Candidatus Zixiibacteriota bacterium]
MPEDLNSILEPKPESDKVSESIENKSVFLSPAGAVIALICFFLPWVKFSCSGIEQTVSGSQIGGELWIIFAASVIILVVFYLFRNQKQLDKACPVVILSSLAGLAVLLFKFLKFATPQKTEFGTITLKDIGLSIQFGAVGTVIGLLMALIGSGFLKSQENLRITAHFCADCGTKLQTDDEYCPTCGAKAD